MTPFTCHVTAVLVVFVTVAVNDCVLVVTTDATVGEIEITTGFCDAVIVTVADADFVGSACEMAETVTVAGFGTAEGAV